MLYRTRPWQRVATINIASSATIGVTPCGQSTKKTRGNPWSNHTTHVCSPICLSPSVCRVVSRFSSRSVDSAAREIVATSRSLPLKLPLFPTKRFFLSLSIYALLSLSLSFSSSLLLSSTLRSNPRERFRSLRLPFNREYLVVGVDTGRRSGERIVGRLQGGERAQPFPSPSTAPPRARPTRLAATATTMARWRRSGAICNSKSDTGRRAWVPSSRAATSFFHRASCRPPPAFRERTLEDDDDNADDDVTTAKSNYVTQATLCRPFGKISERSRVLWLRCFYRGCFDITRVTIGQPATRTFTSERTLVSDRDENTDATRRAPGGRLL